MKTKSLIFNVCFFFFIINTISCNNSDKVFSKKEILNKHISYTPHENTQILDLFYLLKEALSHPALNKNVHFNNSQKPSIDSIIIDDQFQKTIVLKRNCSFSFELPPLNKPILEFWLGWHLKLTKLLSNVDLIISWQEKQGKTTILWKASKNLKAPKVNWKHIRFSVSSNNKIKSWILKFAMISHDNHSKKVRKNICFYMSKPTIFSKRIIPQKQNNGNGLNVVLITMDTTRRDHISVCNEEKYGVALPYKVKIPGLKQLAKDSTVFTNAITPISSTGPAHTSMLTGLYPISFGVHRNGQALPQQITALPEILLQRGYKTAAFISGFPLKSYLCGLQQGFEVYNDFFQGDGKRWEEKASFTTKKAIKWIKNAHYPYFLWLHYYDPHALYRPPEPFKSFYDPDYKGHFDDIIAKYWHEKKKIFFNEIGLTPRDIAHGRALYAGEISYMDSNIGEVLYYLRHSSAWKKTIVIAVADHGEYLAEHGFFFHHDGIKEQLMRIPLIIHIPDAQVPKIKVPVSLIDLSPTILELLSINNPKFKFDGLSLKPLILQHSDRKKIVSKQFNNRILFGEFLNKLCLYERNLKYVEVFDDSNDIYSVPNPFKWKKIREFVYDIKKDPYETQNLINKNFSRQKQAKMKETIQQWFISSRFIEKHRNIKEDETVIRSLKALGYIQY